jgi:hypothetical protein
MSKRQQPEQVDTQRRTGRTGQLCQLEYKYLTYGPLCIEPANSA